MTALTILTDLGFLYFTLRWTRSSAARGFYYSALTGVCVRAGTVAFFLLFQRRGPLSSVSGILAGGAAIVDTAGIVLFYGPVSWRRLLGVILAITGLFLLRNYGNAGMGRKSVRSGYPEPANGMGPISRDPSEPRRPLHW